ncbi:hypothetical protein C0J52_01676 [Blattella germanica]|nr:hypothetical protein C0J52_01676 [Blattella germanica]
MANDALASRREARRRRILENSENRLQKITGRNDITANATFSNEDPCPIAQNGAYLHNVKNGPVQQTSIDPEISGDDCFFQHPGGSNSTLLGRKSCKEKENPLLDQRNINKEDLTEQRDEPQILPSNFYIFYSTKLHLICLALLVEVMLIIDCGFLFGKSLFAPLCIVEATDFLLINLTKQKTKPSAGILTAALLLSGIPQHKVAKFSNGLQTLIKIGKDFCIYFFTFITFHAVLNWQDVENMS